MRSSTTTRFWKTFANLPVEVQRAARKQYQNWLADTRHPLVQFKKTGPFWSVRITNDYRALALLDNGIYYWFWIGTHAQYDQILKT